VGSGAYPAHSVPTYVVSVAHESIPPGELALRLRLRPLPVFARVKNDRVLFDPRTVQPAEDAELVAAVRDVSGAGSAGIGTSSS
jgi:L-seryl-tRNA(Ser) seleniumtransferase